MKKIMDSENNCLIGYTGFVGSNICKQSDFAFRYNSSNINDIKGREFNVVVCAGVQARKWYANLNPEEDWNQIEILLENLKNVKCKYFVLISTIDVYENPQSVDENTLINIEKLNTYGKHRFMVEQFVKERFPDYSIIRLPGLFGEGLKKNIIYDFLHNNQIEKIDSKSVFQFYNLENIYNDILIAIKNNIRLINFATEPVSVKEVIKSGFDVDFDNKYGTVSTSYNIQTVHASLFGANGDYIQPKKVILSQIKQFVLSQIEVKK